MSLFVVFILVFLTGVVTTLASFALLTIAHKQPPTDWVVVHVISPVLRIISLIILVSLVFPVLFTESSVTALWLMLSREEQFNNLLNILFFSSLLMAFVPVVEHPMIAMPVQGSLAIAVVFDWFFATREFSVAWFPDLWTLTKLLLVMLVVFVVGHHLVKKIAKVVDEAYHLSGSIQLVADIVYLPLLIPVILIYGQWLKQQVPITALLGPA